MRPIDITINKEVFLMKHKIKKITAVLLVVAAVFVSMTRVTSRPVRAYNDGIETFVNSLYSDCLGRSADPAGFNDWCNRLASGQITGKQAAYGFFFSQEFISRSFSPESMIDTFYRVFLNRTADPAGKSYWLSKINRNMDFAVADAILFEGFADSTEFAGKCASCGITVGDHIDVSGITSSSLVASDSAYANAVNSMRTDIYGSLTSLDTAWMRSSGSGIGSITASSVEELDAYWTSQGYEIYYIPIGEGYQDENHRYIATSTVKCYAKFYDMTEHYNLINQWRSTQAMNGGLPALTVISDPNDVRYQYCRQRAVEVAYKFSHRRPVEGSFLENYTYYPDPDFPEGEYGENIYGGGGANSQVRSFEAFRDSPMHAASMRGLYTGQMVCASCTVYFVNPDGLSVTPVSPYAIPYSSATNSGRGFGAATVQLFYGDDYCDWWRHPELGWVDYGNRCMTWPDANGNLIGV